MSPRWRLGNAIDGRDLRAQLERRRRPRDARAKRLLARLRHAELARARAILETGACLRELMAERLWANLGYARFEELLAALGIGRSQAWKLMALAEGASAERVAALGVEGAYRELRDARR